MIQPKEKLSSCSSVSTEHSDTGFCEKTLDEVDCPKLYEHPEYGLTWDARYDFKYWDPIPIRDAFNVDELDQSTLSFNGTDELKSISRNQSSETLVTSYYDPDVTFYPQNEFPDDFNCGDGITFAPKCVFGSNNKFGNKCSFGGKCQFGPNSTFGANCRFGGFSKFGSHTVFGANCLFVRSCNFDQFCFWNQQCVLGSGCRVKKGIFAISCTFASDVKLVKCRFASSFDKSRKEM